MKLETHIQNILYRKMQTAKFSHESVAYLNRYADSSKGEYGVEVDGDILSVCK